MNTTLAAITGVGKDGREKHSERFLSYIPRIGEKFVIDDGIEYTVTTVTWYFDLYDLYRTTKVRITGEEVTE